MCDHAIYMCCIGSINGIGFIFFAMFFGAALSCVIILLLDHLYGATFIFTKPFNSILV